MSSKIKNVRDLPFNTITAEDEKKFIKSIFFKPSYYDEFVDSVANGASRILIGQRGLGKTLSMYSMLNDLKGRKVLSILIKNYDGFPLQNNEAYFLAIILRDLTNEIAKYLYENRSKRKALTELQEARLSLFIQYFYDPTTSSFYLEKTKKIRSIKWSIKWRSFFNKNLKVINSILSGVQSFSSTFVRECIGLSIDKGCEVFKEFVSSVSMPSIEMLDIKDIANLDIEKLKNYLNQILEIIQAIGFNTTVVVFDGFDEKTDICGNVKKVSEFTKYLLKDTHLHYIDNLSIVLSLWSEVKLMLDKEGVRFDKFEVININWKRTELESLINHRLKYFSNIQGNEITMDKLFIDKNHKEKVLELAYGSPRSLISLLKKIYYKEKGNEIASFSIDAILEGIMEFCTSFPYAALYTKEGTNEIGEWIDKLLSMKRTSFTLQQVKDHFGKSQSTSRKYIENWEKYGIVKKNIIDESQYDVIDPRLIYLISRQVTRLN